jgi:hypothetical protein
MLTASSSVHDPGPDSRIAETRLTEFMEYSLRCSVDLQPERFDDRRPESNIGSEGLPEFFGV